jgi:Fe-S cluster biogenesis protein NfuA
MAPTLREALDEINAASTRVRPQDVRFALDALRPGLLADGGNVELIAIDEDGIVHLELQGACATCPSREATLSLYLLPALKKRVPGVVDVILSASCV